MSLSTTGARGTPSTGDRPRAAAVSASATGGRRTSGIGDRLRAAVMSRGMSSETSTTILRRTLVVAVAASLSSVGAVLLLDRSADEREHRLRTRRLEVQTLERRLHRLDADGAAATLAALGADRDALRVRLVEALDAARAAPGAGAIRHHVDERTLPDGTDTVTLRLTLEGRIAHGAALLELLAAVHAAGRPWPTETRGCRLQRLAAALALDCAVDILHWRVPKAAGDV